MKLSPEASVEHQVTNHAIRLTIAVCVVGALVLVAVSVNQTHPALTSTHEYAIASKQAVTQSCIRQITTRALDAVNDETTRNSLAVANARVYSGNDDWSVPLEKSGAWDDDNFKTIFIDEPHKTLLIGQDDDDGNDNNLALLYQNNLVVMIDSRACRVTNVYNPTSDGHVHPQLAPRMQSVRLVRGDDTPCPTSAPTRPPTANCKPGQTKTIRIVYQNRGAYTVGKVRFSVYNAAGQQLIPGGSVIKGEDLKLYETHHIKKEILWCWAYRVRIKIYIQGGEDKIENFRDVSFRVWRKPTEKKNPGKGGDSFCAYSQGTLYHGNDVKRERKGDMITTPFSSYDCSSF